MHGFIKKINNLTSKRGKTSYPKRNNPKMTKTSEKQIIKDSSVDNSDPLPELTIVLG